MSDLNILNAVTAYDKTGGIKHIDAGVSPEKSEGNDFTSLVENALKGAVSNVGKAEQAASGSVTGEVDMADLAIAVANAETSLKAIVAIRDKIVSAYQDIIRMPI